MEKSRFRIAVRCKPKLVLKKRKSGAKWAEFNCDKADKKITFEETEFEFDHVFGYEDDQDAVYSTSVKRLVTNVMQGGCNVAVLAYGQTNSGKTYTMGMDHNMYKKENEIVINDNHGIVPRVLHDIFRYAELPTNVNISFLEVYNDKIYDLLSEEMERRPLQLIEEGNKPKGLTQREVTTVNEALKLLVDGSMKRSTSPSTKNLISSRSHAAFTIQIKKIIGCEELISQIMLVDLAGSEAPSKMGSVGETFNEGCLINNSLLALHAVIKALNTKGQYVHVPYRNSTLTRLLKPYLEGDGETLMIVCVTPTIDSFTTLKFAAEVKQVKSKPNEPATARKRPYETPWQHNKKTSVHTVSCAKLLPQPQFTTTRVQQSLLKANESFETLTGNDTIEEVQHQEIEINQENDPRLAVLRPSEPLANGASPSDRNYLREILSIVQGIRKPDSHGCTTNKLSLSTPDRRAFSKVAREVGKLRKSMVRYRTSQCPLLESTAAMENLSDVSSSDEIDDFNKVPVPPKPAQTADECKPKINPRRSVRLSVLREINYKDTKLTAEYTAKPINVKKRTSTKCDDRNPECSTLYGLQNKALRCKPRREKKKSISGTDKGSSGNTIHIDILEILNSGDLKKLQALPCIGPKSALMIRNWVHIKGKLNSVADLKDVHSLSKNFHARFIKANLC